VCIKDAGQQPKHCAWFTFSYHGRHEQRT
jgi:hypothetical protein